MSAKWIVCKQLHYDQHFMECGPRMLLAGTILAYHPEPTENSLLPLMHPNLSNISRIWVASTIVSQSFQYSTIQTLLCNQYHAQTIDISLRAHATNIPIACLPNTHPFMQQTSKLPPSKSPCQTLQISPYLQQRNAVTPQENKNKKKGQHNIKHQKKVNKIPVKLLTTQGSDDTSNLHHQAIQDAIEEAFCKA